MTMRTGDAIMTARRALPGLAASMDRAHGALRLAVFACLGAMLAATFGPAQQAFGQAQTRL